MSNDRFRLPPAQPPAPLAELAAQHHAAVRAGAAADPASRMLGAFFKKEKGQNFFGGNTGWGATITPDSRPSASQNLSDGVGDDSAERRIVHATSAREDDARPFQQAGAAPRLN